MHIDRRFRDIQVIKTYECATKTSINPGKKSVFMIPVTVLNLVKRWVGKYIVHTRPICLYIGYKTPTRGNCPLG